MTFDIASATESSIGFDLASAAPATRPQVQRQGSGPWDAWVAGWQGSATGLIKRGRLPDVVLDQQHAEWYEHALEGAGSVVPDILQMAAGAFAGGAIGTALAPGIGTIAGAGAGAFAVPTAIRESLIQAYQARDADSSADFLDRAGIVIKQTGKSALVGALTAGAGTLAARGIGTAVLGTMGTQATMRTIGAAQTAAEVGMMTVSPAALEGRLPEPWEIANAAILVGGMKAAGHVAGKIARIYAKTGIEPERVVADAQADPKIAEDLKSSTQDIPKAYQQLAETVNAHEAIPGEKAAAVAQSPFADIPQAAGEPTKPTHINYNYTNTTAEVDGALARLSNIYEDEIQQQRRGEVPHEQTYAEAGDILNRLIGGKDPDVAKMGDSLTTDHQLGARILAKKQMAIGAAENIMEERKAFLADPTPEAKLKYLSSIERAATILSNFLGERAEIGRALEILKTTKSDADRVRKLSELIDTYKKDPDKLAIAMGMMEDPAAVLKAAQQAVKPSTWEKFLEYWKAGLVSGWWTHAANLAGNTTFMAMRPVIEQVASGFGALRGADRVLAMQPLARVIGNINGAFETIKLASKIYELEGFTGLTKAAWQSGAKSQKAEVAQGGAIGGKWGEVVRTSFRVLGAEDSLFKTLNERGELYSVASRMATEEGLSPLTREYWSRVSDIVSSPTEKMVDDSVKAGLRLTFNLPLGEAGKAAQTFIKAWKLQLFAPFTQTPGNIAKEMLRMTPFAPAIKEWREAFAKGGAERDKALAELAVGTALMTATVAMFSAGKITGGAPTKPGERNVKEAAGSQPYSVKVGDTWYDYSRIQPIGTLVGLAADITNAWGKMNDNEQDQVPKVLAIGFANAITNQTMLQGLTMFVRSLAEPDQFFPRMAQSYAASLVPFSGFMRQSAEVMDKEQRRIDGIVDAIKNSVPILRETLLPKINVLTGEPLQAKERFIGQRTVDESSDKVLSEAARLGVGVAKAPKSIQLPIPLDKKLGKVELSPEQQNLFSSTTGQLAHEILTRLVNTEMWDNAPDLMKKQVYAKVFAQARKAGAAKALPGEQRAALAMEMADKLVEKLE